MGTYRLFALFAMLAALACAQPADVQVSGVTNTQAIITYSAPAAVPCTLRLGEGGAFGTPYAPVNDVNPALFPASDTDLTRAGTVLNGQARTLVLGKRAAEKDPHGVFRSRALQAATPHFLEISGCGGTATVPFTTATIPVGNTFPNPYPVDPAAPGEYAWPNAYTQSFQNNPLTPIGESVIDPFTGSKLVRLGGPADYWTAFSNVASNRYLGAAAAGAFDPTGQWKGAGGPIGTLTWVADGVTTPAKLYIPLDVAASGWRVFLLPGPGNEPRLDAFWVTLAGSAAAAAGNDASVNLCLTTDGVHCTGATLTRSLIGCAAGCDVGGSSTAFTPPILSAWFPDTTPAVSSAGVAVRNTIADYDPATGTLSWVSGPYFSESLAPGSLVWSGASALPVQTVSPLAVVIPPGTPYKTVMSSAAATTNIPGANNDVAYTAVAHGRAGNSVSMAYVDPAKDGQISVSVNGSAITVTLARASGAITSTANEVVAAIRASADPSALVSAALAPGNDGSGLVAPLSKTALDGGGVIQSTNIGVLVWKTTNTRGTSVTLTQVKFNSSFSSETIVADSVLTQHCNTNPLPGTSVYLCSFRGENVQSFDTSTGAVKTLMNLYSPSGVAIGHSVYPAAFPANGASLYWDGNDPRVFYAAYVDNANRFTIVRHTFSGDASSEASVNYLGTVIRSATIVAQAAPSYIARVNLNDDGSATRGLYSLVQQFAPGFGAAGAPFNIPERNCQLRGLWGNLALIACTSSQDNAPGGWFIAWDLSKSVAGGQNPVIGLAATTVPGSSTSLCRWCVHHNSGVGATGSGMYANLGLNPAFGAPQFRTTLAQPLDAAATVVSVAGDPGNGAIDQFRPNDYIRVDREYMQVVERVSATTLNVRRAAPAAHNAGATVSGYCPSSVPGAGITGTWWDPVHDPFGNAILASTATGHGTYREGMEVHIGNGSCGSSGLKNCYAVRLGDIPASLDKPDDYFINVNETWAGINREPYPESHPSLNANASASGNQWAMDGRVYEDESMLGAGSWSRAGADLWVNSAPDLHPKLTPTFAHCGSRPFADVSGPASAISGDPADAYKWCYAWRDGECVRGSQAGSAFVNCPYVTYSAGNGCSPAQNDSNNEFSRDLCLYEGNATLGSAVMQFRTGQSEPSSASRVITYGLQRYHRAIEPYRTNGKSSPDGAWAFYYARYVDGLRTDVWAARVPPLPDTAAAARTTFTSVPLFVDVPAGIAVDNALVEFGYAENGSDPAAGAFYCSSRRETCAAYATDFADSDPFAYEIADAPPGQPCSNGCVISVPAVSGRVLFYRSKFRDSYGSVVATSPAAAITVP